MSDQGLNKKYEVLESQNKKLLSENKQLKRILTHLDQATSEKIPEEEKGNMLSQNVDQNAPAQVLPNCLILKDTLKTNHEYVCPHGLCSIDSQNLPRIVSVGTEGLVTIYNLVSKEIRELNHNQKDKKEEFEFAFSIKIDQGKNLLFIANIDGNIEVWNCEPNPKLLRAFTSHTGHIFSLECIPFLKAVVSVDASGKILIWNPLNLQLLITMKIDNKEPICVCNLENTKQIVVGFACGEISVFNLRDSETGVIMNASVKGHNKQVISLASVAKGTSFVSVSNDGFVKIWKVTAERGLECVKEIFESVDNIRHAVLIEGKDMLVTNCWTGYIRFWKVSTGEKIGEHRDFTFGRALTVIDKNGEFATGLNPSGEVKVWKIQ